ncbi:MAG: hypothetical protein RLZZ519_2549 [Bacteroidota bacterium]|jgi:antitoxin component YwqK of YwqJK toxin-antitoxin module
MQRTRLTLGIVAAVYLFSGCGPKARIEDPNMRQWVAFDSTALHTRQDTLFQDQVKFSGSVIALFPTTKDTAYVMPYQAGVLHGISRKWHRSGNLMEYREYANGKKNGPQISFWETGRPRFAFVAVNDGYEGELREWDAHGRLSHLGHFVDGQESGEQKMWYENGKIRSNYVMRNGRRYGLLGTKNCENVTDSIVGLR